LGGLADELLNVLAKTSGLHVIARTPYFDFEGKQVTLAEIAKSLRVANILEGSVRKSGDRLRVITNPTDNVRAMEAFRKTIALDPGCADAYATLSNGQSTSGSVTAKAGAATLTSGSGASKTITRPTTSSNP
jgi:hypothetical protein